MALTKKTIKFTLFFVVVAILGVSAYYLYPLFIGEQEQPPSISISANKFQGLLKKEDVCKLPGYEYTKTMLDAYMQPADLSEDQQYELLGGDHLYHADEEFSIKEILDLIVPIEGNKVIIAYYNPSYTTADKAQGFHLYPKIEGTNEITDPNTFKIQPNQGFAILSCQDTAIWKVKNEKESGKETLPTLLGQLSNDWILVPMIEGKEINDLLTADTQAKVTSVWLQKGPGFDFEKVDLKDLDGDYLGYYMVWFKVDKSILATLPKDEPEVEIDIKEAIEEIQQEILQSPSPDSVETDEQIETTGEAQIDKALQESIDDKQGLQFGSEETIFGEEGSLEEKQSDASDAPEGSQLKDMDLGGNGKSFNRGDKDYSSTQSGNDSPASDHSYDFGTQKAGGGLQPVDKIWW